MIVIFIPSDFGRQTTIFFIETPMIVYGIKNCNTVKTALDWLKKHNVEFEFHDYKTKGITDARLKDWSKQVGWESLVNKRGTTWRQLDEATQAGVKNESAAVALMKEKTSVIKRPLIEHDGKVLTLGFDEQEYKKVFKK
jgi:arsenate reductase (glutaredoxin)